MMNEKKTQTTGKPDIERLVREAKSTSDKLAKVRFHSTDVSE